MPNFFVEFRFHGYAKHQLKGLIHEVAREFRIRGAIRYRPVPHMALFYGSQGMVDIRKLCAAVKKVGEKYILVPFKVEGFGWDNGEEGKVIAANMTASPELKKLRQELAEELSKICTPHRFDTKPNFWFHSTIAFKDIDGKFDRIWRYLNKKQTVSINQHLVRITVLKNSKIIGEYDLELKRWLSRWQVIPPYGWYWWRKTMNKLRELHDSSQKRKPSLWKRIISRIKSIGIKKSIYVIADTHFDHKNIIRYCSRPFRDTRQMNKTIMRNWNNTVKAEDIVYFLGDWAFGRGHKPARYWYRRLKGRIVSIRGSHDLREKGLWFEVFKVLQYRGYSFLLIHDPNKAGGWHNWIIHGHKHNNNMMNYPFINGDRKTINVSVELINYQPLDVEHLLSLSIDSIRRMETINSQPERW